MCEASQLTAPVVMAVYQSTTRFPLAKSTPVGYNAHGSTKISASEHPQRLTPFGGTVNSLNATTQASTTKIHASHGDVEGRNSGPVTNVENVAVDKELQAGDPVLTLMQPRTQKSMLVMVVSKDKTLAPQQI